MIPIAQTAGFQHPGFGLLSFMASPDLINGYNVLYFGGPTNDSIVLPDGSTASHIRCRFSREDGSVDDLVLQRDFSWGAILGVPYPSIYDTAEVSFIEDPYGSGSFNESLVLDGVGGPTTTFSLTSRLFLCLYIEDTSSYTHTHTGFSTLELDIDTPGVNSLWLNYAKRYPVSGSAGANLEVEYSNSDPGSPEFTVNLPPSARGGVTEIPYENIYDPPLVPPDPNQSINSQSFPEGASEGAILKVYNLDDLDGGGNPDLILSSAIGVIPSRLGFVVYATSVSTSKPVLRGAGTLSEWLQNSTKNYKAIHKSEYFKPWIESEILA